MTDKEIISPPTRLPAAKRIFLWRWLAVGIILVSLPWWLSYYQSLLIKFQILPDPQAEWRDARQNDSQNYQQVLKDNQASLEAKLEELDHQQAGLLQLQEEARQIIATTTALKEAPRRDAAVIMVIKLSLLYQRVLNGELIGAELASTRLWFAELKPELGIDGTIAEAWEQDFGQLAELPNHVPTEAALTREFDDIAGQIHADLMSIAPPDESWKAMMIRNLSRLLKFRPLTGSDNHNLADEFPINQAELILITPNASSLAKAAVILAPYQNQSPPLASWLLRVNQRQQTLQIIEKLQGRALALWHRTSGE